MQKITAKRKAISPIIATLLLILIAIAAGVVVYAYVLGFVGNSTGNGSVGTESISVASTSASASSGVVQLYVQNTGGNSYSLSQIYETVASSGAVNQITSPTSALVTIACASGSTCTNLQVTGLEFSTSTTLANSGTTWNTAVLLKVASGCTTTGTITASLTLYFGWLITGAVVIPVTGITATSADCSAPAYVTLGSLGTVGTISNTLSSSGSLVTTSVSTPMSQVQLGASSATSSTTTFNLQTTTGFTSVTAASFTSGSAAQAVQFVSPSSGSGLTSGGTYTYKIVGADGTSQIASVKAK